MKRLTTTTVTMVAAAVMLGALVVPAASAATSVVVQGTNTAPDDLAAVQTAVSGADRVTLEGTFDFGNGTLVIDRDLTLMGRRGALVRNGGDAAALAPTIGVVDPASSVTIRNLRMEGSADIAIATQGVRMDIRHNDISATGYAGIHVADGAGSRVQSNTVTESLVGVVVESSDVRVHNNRLEVTGAGLQLFAASTSDFTNNTISVVGTGNGLFDVGRAGVFLVGGNEGNEFKNNRLEGVMTYGYLFGAGAEDNHVTVNQRDLRDATFVTPPFFGLCQNGPGEANEGGAAVVLEGDSDFGPATTGNTVIDRTRSAVILDCGVDNTIR